MNCIVSRSRRVLGAVVLSTAFVGAGIFFWSTSRSGAQETAPAPTEPRVVASDPIAAGRYLVRIAGCNDCHTPGFMEHGEDIPESEWLTGLPIGWRGPWGTTYAQNLRIFVKFNPEDLFVQVLRARKVRPPMPWQSLHAMSDDDLRAMYKYIKSLKPVGKPTPLFVPPEQEPSTPYFLLDPELAARVVHLPKNDAEKK